MAAPAAGGGRAKAGGTFSFSNLRFILVLLIICGFASVVFLMSPAHGGASSSPRRAVRGSRWSAQAPVHGQTEDADEDDDEDDYEEGVGTAQETPRSRQQRPAALPVVVVAGKAMPKGQDLPAPPAASLLSMDERLAQGKLIFLFMLQDGLPHADLWKAFFAGAPRSSFRAFAHCSKPEPCRQSKAFAELGIELVRSVPSKWCSDLVSPSWQLLDTALRADEGGSKGEPQKFVLVSDSTLPVQTMSRMRQVLLKTDHSDLCISPRNEWAAVSIFGITYSIVKHHQWAVLNREDAEAFAKAWPMSSSYSSLWKNGVLDLAAGDYKWNLPRMGPDGKANLSATIARSLIPAPGRCPDEEAFTSLIFGLHEGGTDAMWQNIIDRSVCRTYVNWNCKNPPEVFSKMTDKLRELMRDTSEKAYLFARKFKKDASLKELKAFHQKASSELV